MSMNKEPAYRIFIMLCLFILFVCTNTTQASSQSLSRDLPDSYCDGQSLSVSLEIVGFTDASTAYTVDEVLPIGWTATSVSDGGQWSPIYHHIRWFFMDGQNRTLSYTAVSELGLNGTQVWGIGSQFGYIVGGSLTPIIKPIGGERYLSKNCEPYYTPTPTNTATPIPIGSTRDLPDSYCDGLSLSVSLSIVGFTDASTAYTVDEVLPLGWTATSVSDGGQWNPISKHIRWFFMDGQNRTLSYSATSEMGLSGTQVWGSGSQFGYIVDGNLTPIIKPIGGERYLLKNCEPYFTPTPTSTEKPIPVGATRDLPDSYCDGQSLSVSLSIVGFTDASTAYTVDEVLPSGWTATYVSDGGQWNPINRHVRWFFMDGQNRTLSYSATSEVGLSGTQVWGTGSQFGYIVDGSLTPIIRAIGGDKYLSNHCDQYYTPTPTEIIIDTPTSTPTYTYDPTHIIEPTLTPTVPPGPAILVAPNDGAVVGGNAIAVEGRVLTGAVSDVREVLFQRKSIEGWIPLEPLSSGLNPDASAPYVVTWNTSTEEGTVTLRSLTRNVDNSLILSPTISVTIDQYNAEVISTTNELGNHITSSVVYSESETVVSIGDPAANMSSLIIFPPNSVSSSTSVEVELIPPDRITDIEDPVLRANTLAEIKIDLVGNQPLASTITITIAYPDADEDGFVDNTTPPIPENQLVVVRVDSFGDTIPLKTTIHPMDNIASAQTNHLSTFLLVNGLMPRPTPTETAIDTITNTPTDSSTFTETPTYTISETPTLTITDTPTITESPTETFTDTPTITKTPTDTVTDTPTVTMTPTHTVTDSPTITKTPTDTVTGTPTKTYTSTLSLTPSFTPTKTGTITKTKTPTPSQRPSRTPTNTRTPKPTKTPIETFTPTPTCNLLGDANDDGRVNLLDLRIVLRSLGQNPGHPAYDPRADINSDGSVDMVDVLIVTLHFGDSCGGHWKSTSNLAGIDKSTMPIAVIRPSVSGTVPAVGDEISVEIIIEDVEDLAGYQLEFYYDSSELEVLGWAEGPFLRGASGEHETLTLDVDTSTPGIVRNIVSTWYEPYGLSGDGVLFTLSFRLTAQMTSGFGIGGVLIVGEDTNADAISKSTEELLANNRDPVVQIPVRVESLGFGPPTHDTNGSGRIDAADLIELISMEARKSKPDVMPRVFDFARTWMKQIDH